MPPSLGATGVALKRRGRKERAGGVEGKGGRGKMEGRERKTEGRKGGRERERQTEKKGKKKRKEEKKKRKERIMHVKA